MHATRPGLSLIIVTPTYLVPSPPFAAPHHPLATLSVALLRLHQTVVDAALREEHGVAPLLHHDSSLDDSDHVAVLDGREAMGDRDGRALVLGHQHVERRLHHLLGVVIERRRRLTKQQEEEER